MLDFGQFVDDLCERRADGVTALHLITALMMALLAGCIREVLPETSGLPRQILKRFLVELGEMEADTGQQLQPAEAASSPDSLAEAALRTGRLSVRLLEIAAFVHSMTYGVTRRDLRTARRLAHSLFQASITQAWFAIGRLPDEVDRVPYLRRAAEMEAAVNRLGQSRRRAGALQGQTK